MVALGWAVGVGVAPWWLPQSAMAGAVGALAAGVAVWRGSRVALVGLGMALGWLGVATQPSGPVVRGWVTVDGRVAGAAVGSEADVAVRRLARPGEAWQASRGRVRVRFSGRPPSPGTPVIVAGRAQPLQRPTLPGGPDAVTDARRGRVHTRIVARDAAVVGGERPTRHVPGDATGLLRALALGDRSSVAPERLERLRRTGTSHLLAISGLHVGAVAGAVTALGLLLLRGLAVFRAQGVPQGPAWLLGAMVALVWAWSVGAPVSAQRAAVLVLMVALGRATGRSPQPWALLGLAAVVVLTLDPGALGTASFQLSFGAVAGLIRWQPVLARPARRWWAPLRWLWGSLATTVAATLGTLPAAAWWFQEVAPLSPVANLIAVPVVTFWVAPCAALATWAAEPVGGWAGALGTLGVQVLEAGLEPLALGPLTPAVGPLRACALAALLLVPRHPWRGLLPALLLLLLRPVPTATQVTFLDVGQGDAALVEHEDGTRILVDGGPPGRQVLHWLRRRGVRRLHRVVVSHCQADHAGGLEAILEAVQVDELWVPEAQSCATLLACAVEQGVRLRLRPPEALSPPPGFDPDDPNDGSLVVREAGVLFTGDIEKTGEAAVAGRLEPTPVLKVAHHGSRTSTDPAFLGAVRPTVAVISAGRRNLFGHPHPHVVARLAAAGVQTYRTDQHGTVVVRVTTHGVAVRTKRAGESWTAWRVHPRVPEPTTAAARRPPRGSP